MQRITTSRWAAMQAGRIYEGSVEHPDCEGCAQCGLRLHPYPKPSYWMEFPLPVCLIVDGKKLCIDDRKPSCLAGYLETYPTKLESIQPPKPRRPKTGETREMMSDDAAKIRKEADQAELARRLAQWPASADTGYRSPGSITWEGCLVGRKPPASPVKLAERLQKELEAEIAHLERDCAIYDEYRTTGLSRVSDYDLAMAGWPQMNVTERAWKALECALWLKHAHTTYHRSMIVSIKVKLAELEYAIAAKASPVKPPKDIPPGYEFVDVWLTPQQAFTARKWAEAAKKKIEQERKS